MPMIEIKWDADRRFLRQFGALFVLFFGIVGAFQVFKHDAVTTGVAIWIVAGLLGVIGWFYTPLLRAIYLGWMIAIFPIAWVVSYAILGFIFYLVITPIGFMMRRCGRDPMHRRFDSDAASYWIDRPSESRGAERYFKQF